MLDFIEQVRARRMVAAVEYHSLKNAKLAKASAKVQERVNKQIDLLEKEVLRLDSALAKVEDRLNTIDQLKQEIGILADQIIDPNEDTNDDN